MSRLGLSLPSAAVLRGRARPMPAQAAALMARMSAPPAAARAGTIAALVRALVAAGIWQKLDLLYVLAAHDAQAARLNWMGAGYALTAVNSPSFVADRGYVGGTNAYLASGFNAATGGVAYSQDNAHVSVWDLTEREAGNIIPVGASTGTAVQLGMLHRYSTDRCAFSVNDQSSTFSNGRSDGFFVGSRLSSAGRSVYRNGVLLADHVAASMAVPPLEVDLLCFKYNNGANRGYWCTDRIAVFSMGAGLTFAEQAAFHAALQAYLQAVGAVA